MEELSESESSSLPPGLPVKMVSASSVALAVALTASVPVTVAVVLYFLGLLAPQGWSCRQEEAQVLLPLQSSTHWLPHSWQT